MPDSPGAAELDQTEVGSYFVANYPPFSVWTPDAVGRDARPALAAPASRSVPLGLYLHIPFCRKRCHFCYFRVYTDKNAREVEEYLDLLAREWELYLETPAIAGRPLNFVYFGGGTPSFLSTSQLQRLVSRLTAGASWDTAEEVTFECEPGTLTEPKLESIRALGVTRLSLGVENFNDRILELNGRAHRSPEIDRAYRFARALGFPQINIDLIAGMLGETDENWAACIRRTLELEPDSVTIYQMELPYNTTISRDLLKKTGQFSEPVASWATKRRWVDEAFDALERAGYHVGSAYTAVKDPDDHELRLSRSPLAGGRPGRPRRGVVRPRQRRAHAERGHVGHLEGGDRARRAAARPRLPSDRRGADDSRVRAAAEARRAPSRLFLREVRRRSARPVSRAARQSGRGRLPDARSPRAAGAHPRRLCSASTSCCSASSCPSTPASVTRNEKCRRLPSPARCCGPGILATRSAPPLRIN